MEKKLWPEKPNFLKKIEEKNKIFDKFTFKSKNWRKNSQKTRILTWKTKKIKKNWEK